MEEKQNAALGTAPLGKLMVKFALPCTISLLVGALYNIVDQIFIGWGVGYLGNGATNVVFPLTVLALGLAHSQQAMQAERAVTDMTNDLLKKNAEALKMGTIETAKESQRGVVDIETLQQTNKSLIETLDELNKIQTEGRAKRVAAEQELTRIEDELKTKMMEIRS